MENSSGLFLEIRIFTICKALHNDMKPALSGIPQILENINI